MTIWARGVINIFVIYPFLKHCATGKGFFCSIKTYFRQIISFSRYIYILILYPLQFFLGFSTKKLNHKKYFHTHTYFLTSQCYYMYNITHICSSKILYCNNFYGYYTYLAKNIFSQEFESPYCIVKMKLMRDLSRIFYGVQKIYM